MPIYYPLLVRRLIRQPVYGLPLEYKDLNYHRFLWRDPGFQKAVLRKESLTSSATLCRWQNRFIERREGVPASCLLLASVGDRCPTAVSCAKKPYLSM